MPTHRTGQTRLTILKEKPADKIQAVEAEERRQGEENGGDHDQPSDADRDKLPDLTFHAAEPERSAQQEEHDRAAGLVHLPRQRLERERELPPGDKEQKAGGRADDQRVFQDVQKHLSEKYDVITLIGVLEYAGSYIDSDNPYEDFIKTLKTHLKPNGRIIIAIENRFGLKYWEGAKEDHTGGFFEGLEGYSEYKQRVKYRILPFIW